MTFLSAPGVLCKSSVLLVPSFFLSSSFCGCRLRVVTSITSLMGTSALFGGYYSTLQATGLCLSLSFQGASLLLTSQTLVSVVCLSLYRAILLLLGVNSRFVDLHGVLLVFYVPFQCVSKGSPRVAVGSRCPSGRVG